MSCGQLSDEASLRPTACKRTTCQRSSTWGLTRRMLQPLLRGLMAASNSPLVSAYPVCDIKPKKRLCCCTLLGKNLSDCLYYNFFCFWYRFYIFNVINLWLRLNDRLLNMYDQKTLLSKQFLPKQPIINQLSNSSQTRNSSPRYNKTRLPQSKRSIFHNSFLTDNQITLVNYSTQYHKVIQSYTKLPSLIKNKFD